MDRAAGAGGGGLGAEDGAQYRHGGPEAYRQAAFRIVQEALTNAARHGNGGARVALTYAETAVDVWPSPTPPTVVPPLVRAAGMA